MFPSHDPPVGSTKEIGQLNEDVKPLKNEEITSLRKELYQLPSVKTIGDVMDQSAKMESAYQSYLNGEVGAGSTDRALAVMFQKMLDPGSVVREGEFDRTASGQSTLDAAKAYLTKLRGGGIGINDNTRADMVEMAKQFAEVSQERFKREVKFYVDEAERGQVDPERILGSYYNYYEDDPLSATPVSTTPTTTTQNDAVDNILSQYGVTAVGSILDKYNISY